MGQRGKIQRVWNLGNTTIRNPNRIEQGLKVFADDFQGNVRGTDAEARFTRRLDEAGVINTNGTYNDLFGRKWRGVLVKLGFATDKDFVVDDKTNSVADLIKNGTGLSFLKGLEHELTLVGQRLLNAETTSAIQDVFLRQLVRHELPSPIEPNFPPGQMKPFVFLLQVLLDLYKRGEPGLTKLEIGTFLQSFSNHSDALISDTVRQILDYRNVRGDLAGKIAKKNYDRDVLIQASVAGGVKADTLIDYADTTARYSHMTGLVRYRGTRFAGRLELREERLPIIEALLAEEPKFIAKEFPLQYLEEFYTGTALPTDRPDFAREEIHRVREELEKYKVEPIAKVIPSEVSDVKKIEDTRYQLLEQLSRVKEQHFAAEQMTDDAIIDIIQYLEALVTSNPRSLQAKDIVDAPTYLEWTVWRSFLAIDHIVSPIHTTRQFPVDDDFLPRHTASGGKADMIFEFDDFYIVVEVTLMRSSRQEAAEGEPVRRHVAKVQGETNKDVYGLFIAPSVDNNTAETFRRGSWYWGEEEVDVNIVPMHLSHFLNVFKVLQQRRFTPFEFRMLLNNCLEHRNLRAPEWKNRIISETDRWISSLN